MMPPDIKRVPKPIAPMPYPEASGVLIALALFLTATLIAVEFDVLSPKIALGAATLAALAASIISVASTAAIGGQRSSGAPLSTSASSVAAMSPSTILAAIPDPALLLDASATIVSHNDAAEALFGKSLAGLALEHVSRDPELLNAVDDARAQGESRVARFEQFNGVERHLMATASPIGARGDAPSDMVLVIIRDLSEQHRMLEMRTDFIANASHELRTPLASVRGFIETLQGPAKNDEAARERFLSIMAAQAERMTRLIDDLLLLSRVEERAYLAPTGRVDLDEVIADVVRTLLPIADERGVSITPPRPSRPAIVKGERDELFQVFQNLIENAVKYGRPGGSVAITRSAPAPSPGQPAKIVVTIEDDGPGIAPEHLPRLTERFYRVNADQSRKIGGTGLGLAIVKHVLNRHRGELQIESVVGSGTSVRVTIPDKN